MNQISFISANFVARQLNYNMTEGWMQGDGATQDFFKPLDSFAQRFGAMLGEVKAMGFSAIDLWGAQLHPSWASAEHLQTAKDLLRQHGLKITSIANGMRDLESLKGFCRVASGVGAPIIAGGAAFLGEHRAEAIEILMQYGVKLGVENHPEKTPDEVLRLIGDGAKGYIGAAPDTGWWATQGYSTPAALRELREHLLAVHFKDVLAAGAHETCAFGRGVADIKGCAAALKEIGYSGVIGIEHEPEHYDPRPDVMESKRLLESWLGANA